MSFAKVLHHLDRIAAMEIHVEEYDIRLAGRDGLQIVGFAAARDDVQSNVAIENLAKGFAKQGLMLDNGYSNPHHSISPALLYRAPVDETPPRLSSTAAYEKVVRRESADESADHAVNVLLSEFFVPHITEGRKPQIWGQRNRTVFYFFDLI
jgi:hypothetical protein